MTTALLTSHPAISCAVTSYDPGAKLLNSEALENTPSCIEYKIGACPPEAVAIIIPSGSAVGHSGDIAISSSNNSGGSTKSLVSESRQPLLSITIRLKFPAERFSNLGSAWNGLLLRLN